MRETIYFQRNAPDPILDEAVILDIVRQYIPKAKSVKNIDESGGEARTYAVDDDIILKVQRPQQLRTSTSLEKEVFFLKQLEIQTNVNVPRVLGYGKKDGVEAICMTRMPGIAVERARISKKEKNLLLFELGKELRKIHEIDQKSMMASGLFPQDEPEDVVFRLRRRYQAALRAKENLNAGKLEFALDALEKELQKLQCADRFVAVHANPYICHVFMDEATHQYTGIIDFGDAYIGHPIFDMWYWKAESREILMNGYTAEKPVSEEFLSILHTLNSLTTIVEEYR